MKICGNMVFGLSILLLQRANSYQNIKKRKLVWPDVIFEKPKYLIMLWENHKNDKNSNFFDYIEFY